MTISIAAVEAVALLLGVLAAIASRRARGPTTVSAWPQRRCCRSTGRNAPPATSPIRPACCRRLRGSA